MNAVAVGPLVFAPDRLAAIVAITMFLAVSGFLSGKVSSRFSSWSCGAATIFVVGSRFGHVAEHAANFVGDPLRVFYIWQGGFRIEAGIALAIAYTAWAFRHQLKLVLWSVLPSSVAAFTAIAILALTSGAPALPLPSGNTFRTLANASFDPQSLAGRPMVLNLWATWCPPCRREMPMLAEVAAVSEEIDFIFVNQGEAAETVERYLAEEALVIENVVLDPLGEFGRHYEVMGLPGTLFVGADGKLQAVHMGEISREVLSKQLANLVAR